MSSTILRNILKVFPGQFSYAFAYGSRVKVQSNKQDSVGDMIDIVIAVDDPLTFHRQNLVQNRTHYSFLKHFGPHGVTTIQEKLGARVYYNTLVPLDDGNLIKYGVIGTDDLINDLLDWETLYMSGRLHKPVEVIQEPNTDSLTKALRLNLQNAVHTALLLLEETFTEEQFYMTIANLSYSGDFRMTFGEDKNKVANIVKPQISAFRAKYQPYLVSDAMQGLVTWNPATKSFLQNCSSRVVLHHLNLLPKHVQRHLYMNWVRNSSVDLDDVLISISQSFGAPNQVKKAVDQIVWKSSCTQSLKGILTAGFTKSAKYSLRKVNKMFKSLAQSKETSK
ncbi:Phosphatidate cytidylyltransferase, mitochondrial [Halotydeus destructor]|nr:Phosphatidate cytidylyltransferase, mitochondrial [Halotydeus destructor]